MNNSIENHIFQNELLRPNELLLDEENEINLNLNTQLFHNIIRINNQQFIDKDSISEVNLNEKQLSFLTETNKSITLNEFSKNYLTNLDLVSNFRIKNMHNNIFFDNIYLSNDEFKDIYLLTRKEKNYSENESTKTFLFKNNYNEGSSSKSSHISIFMSNDKKSKIRKFFRVEDAKKHFKVAINNYATEQINTLIKQSSLPKKYKKKIHLPNSKLFTSNSKELDNLDFLSFEMKTVFIYGKRDGNLQEENEKNIIKIMKYNKHPENAIKIKEYLSLKYEEIIKSFYKSEKFNEFKNKELTNFFNEGMLKEKKISLLEDYGLIKLFKMTKKKRKREFFSLK